MTRGEWEKARQHLINLQLKFNRDRLVAQVELNKHWVELMAKEPRELEK